MDILPGFKLCRKGLHWYKPNKLRPGCHACKKQAESLRRKAHKAEIKSKSAKYYKQNKERILKTNAQWKKNNPKRMVELRKNRYEKNKEHHAKQSKEWYKNNPGIVRAKQAKRRAAKKTAVPYWSDKKQIKEIYKKACELTVLTKIKHHVDHVFPLRSNYMCGFHVETNLQIISAEENILKSNQSWPGQLDCQKGSVYARFPKELTDLLND